MGTLIDETGNVHGRLTVISRVDVNGHRQARWLCRCQCGKETTTRGSNLRNGRTRSCGCLRAGAKRLPAGEAAFNDLVSCMKSAAMRGGRVWDLSKEQVRDITNLPCSYCGTAPEQVFRRQRYNGAHVYNGLDRVDNSKGYSFDNVVPCCGRCNVAKNNMTRNTFLDLVHRIYMHSIYYRGER